MSAYCKLIKEEKRRVQKGNMGNLLAGKIETIAAIRHFAPSLYIPLSLSLYLSVCVCLFIIYLFMRCPI